MDNVRVFERNRKQLIAYISARLDGASDARAIKMVRRYCKLAGIPATNTQINEIANEALRRRMIEKIQTLDSQLHQLHDIVIAQGELITDLRTDHDQTRAQLLQLNQKVNSYHP